MSQEHIDDQERIDELCDKWNALIRELEALCATWAQANRDVTALEDIIRKAKGE